MPTSLIPWNFIEAYDALVMDGTMEGRYVGSSLLRCSALWIGCEQVCCWRTKDASWGRICLSSCVALMSLMPQCIYLKLIS